MCFPFLGGKSPLHPTSRPCDDDPGHNDASGHVDAAAVTSGVDAGAAAAPGVGAAPSASATTSTTSLNGDALTYEDPAKLHQQLRQKERELKKREEENQSLREQLISKVWAEQ